MKKIVLLIVLLTLLVTCGCQKEANDEEYKEPLYYSEDLRIVTKDLNSLDDLKNSVIALQDTFDKEYSDYVLECLKEYELTDNNIYWFSSYAAIKPIIDEGKAQAWLMPDKREDIAHGYRTDYEQDNYKILATFNKPYYEEKQIDESLLTKDLYTKPFAVMINGLDCFGQNANQDWANNNSDVNHLLVVNPSLRHVLIVSIPRDMYIKDETTGYYNKINALIKSSPDNIAKSLEQLFDVEINYYCLTSFTWFVEGINDLGGVTLDVPMDVYMNMDSNRNVAQTWSVPKGDDQVLYGEYALALARNRKYNNIVGGDFGRIRNQALIINGLIEKIAYHPYILDMIGMSWLMDYLTENNFTSEEKETLFALAKTFIDGYTIDNYFIDCKDMMKDGIYFAKASGESIEIAKGKIDLVMNNHIDSENQYYEEILKGYITKGAGTIEDGEDGYLGEYYDLKEVFKIK